MRLLLLAMILFLPLTLGAGEDKKETTPRHKTRLTLPAGAEKIEAFTYRYQDTDGKVWIYRQTPFGLVRYEEEKTASPASVKPPKTAADSGPSAAGIKAFDEGDKVRFEKPSPFGKHSWTRRKSELTEQEKKAWEKAQKQQKTKRKTTPE